MEFDFRKISEKCNRSGTFPVRNIESTGNQLEDTGNQFSCAFIPGKIS
jgi:hypothetical protein